jgi:hypothetical protein
MHCTHCTYFCCSAFSRSPTAWSFFMDCQPSIWRHHKLSKRRETHDTASHPWRLEHLRVNLKADTPPTCLLNCQTITSRSPSKPAATSNKRCHLNHKTTRSVCCLYWLPLAEIDKTLCSVFMHTSYQLCLTFGLAEACPSGNCWALLPLRRLPLSAIAQPQ